MDSKPKQTEDKPVAAPAPEQPKYNRAQRRKLIKIKKKRQTEASRKAKIKLEQYCVKLEKGKIV